MNKKLLIIAIIGASAAVLVAGVMIHQPSPSSRAYEILSSSTKAVENLESFKADAYLFDYTDTDVLKESSKYSMKIELLRTEEKGMTMRINFENYEYECSIEEKEAAYESLRQSLKNAWILDTPDKFYVYSPLVFEESVTEFTPQTSLTRYNFIPIADPLHLALLFDHAENATYEGTETIEVGNKMIESYVVSYEFSYPTVRFAENAKLRTWISTEDHIPVKTELDATSTDGASKINFVFGFDTYEKDAFIPIEAVSLPEDLKIIQR